MGANRARCIWWVIWLSGGIGSLAAADPVTPLLVAPTQAVAGSNATVSLVVLNAGAEPMRHLFPAAFPGRLIVDGTALDITLRRPEAIEVVIDPGAFSLQEYALPLPSRPGDRVEVELAEGSGQRVTVRIKPDPESHAGAAADPVAASRVAGQGAVHPDHLESGPQVLPADSAALDFFRAHFFPYEPMYLIMGWEDPKVKFQFSFKYRFLNADPDAPGWLARQVPALTNLYAAYTQTSLWDISAPSAPFYDTSYQPEIFFQRQRLDRGRWADWFAMDLQGGLRHASNGQDGDDSRSMNVAYIMPTFYFGDLDSFYFRLAPRIYSYIGDLEDNPDIADYYGHVQLRAMLGWADSVQLAVIGTIGDGFQHGSAQMDLTYPLYRSWGRNFAVYLDLQYFIGYGETLLDYDQYSSVFRIGFSLWR